MPFQAFGKEESAPSGKLRLQTERIRQNENQESQSGIETEQEKRAPYLFKEETRHTIEAKQRELNSEREKLEQLLFVKTETNDVTMKVTKEILFASDYTVPKTKKMSDKEYDNEEIVNNTLFYTLLGIIILICGGIFALMRKMLG